MILIRSKNKNLDLFYKIVKLNPKKIFYLITSEDIIFSEKFLELKKIKNLKLFYNLSEKKIDTFLRKSSASLFTGLDEDYGMFLAESLSYNLPVVCIKSGFSPYLIDKKYGYIAENNLKSVNHKISLLNNKNIISLSKNIKNSVKKLKINSDNEFYSKIITLFNNM